MAVVINDKNGTVLYKGTYDDCVCWVAETGLDIEYGNGYHIDEEASS